MMMLLLLLFSIHPWFCGQWLVDIGDRLYSQVQPGGTYLVKGLEAGR